MESLFCIKLWGKYIHFPLPLKCWAPYKFVHNLHWYHEIEHWPSSFSILEAELLTFTMCWINVRSFSGVHWQRLTVWSGATPCGPQSVFHDDTGNICPSAPISPAPFLARFLQGNIYLHFNWHLSHQSIEVALARVTHDLQVARCTYSARESELAGTVEVSRLSYLILQTTEIGPDKLRSVYTDSKWQTRSCEGSRSLTLRSNFA